MEFDDYQKLASRTALYNSDDPIYILMYVCLGLVGEAGETIEKVKKIVRNDRGAITDEKRDDLKKELGDVLWYLSELARALGIDLNDVAEANIKKLADRNARGVLKSEGDNR